MKLNHYVVSLLILPALSPIYSQVNLTSSNLPIVVLDTYGQTIPDEPKIAAGMRIIYNGPGNRNYLTDSLNHYDGHIGIEKRGSSSQMFPKKSYAVETRDSLGNNLNVSLLGMPEENDWVLYGPFSDKTLLRNVLTFKIANDLGRYASRTCFCELVLNEDYQGVYVLMEKIKRDRNPVDIKSMQPTYITGDELTGGYIIKIDKNEGSQTLGWYSQFPPYPGAWQQIYYQYHYPDQDDIVPEQQAYIQGYIFQFESLMNSPLHRDPFAGYYDRVDLASFIDFFLVSELGKNVDAYRLSTFMYKDRDSEGGQLTMGPLWDFNLAFGNADYYNGWYTSGWQLNVSISGDYWQNPFYWYKLIVDPVFMNRTARRWYELRQSVLSTGTLLAFIDSCAVELQESQTRNYLRWPILGSYIWPNWFVGQTYQEEIDFLKSWLQDRIAWMNQAFNSQYTRIDWTSAESLELSATVATALKVPLTTIAHNLLNVDSITFISQTAGLLINTSTDTVVFLPQQAGEFTFKGQGWRYGQIIEFSPAYLFNALSVSISEEPSIVPEDLILLQNYPNPFNTSTNIEFQNPKKKFVTLKVFNVLGEEVAMLISGKLEAGSYRFEFRASDLPSGLYLYRLQNGEFIQSRKMLLMK
jgi:hypothetical protein